MYINLVSLTELQNSQFSTHQCLVHPKLWAFKDGVAIQ